MREFYKNVLSPNIFLQLLKHSQDYVAWSLEIAMLGLLMVSGCNSWLNRVSYVFESKGQNFKLDFPQVLNFGHRLR